MAQKTIGRRVTKQVEKAGIKFSTYYNDLRTTGRRLKFFLCYSHPPSRRKRAKMVRKVEKRLYKKGIPFTSVKVCENKSEWVSGLYLAIYVSE